MDNSSGIGSFLLLLLPIALLVWLFFTQRRRQRDVQQLQSGLGVGDEICMTSGMFGTITAIDEGVVSLLVAPDVTVRVDRRAIGLKVVSTTGTTDDTTSPSHPGE